MKLTINSKEFSKNELTEQSTFELEFQASEAKEVADLLGISTEAILDLLYSFKSKRQEEKNATTE